MIDFTIDQGSRDLEKLLSGLGPRVMAEIHQSLKTVLYAGVQAGVEKYFAGSGPKGGPTTTLLTSRSGALANSLLLAAQTAIDPPTPGAGTTEVSAQIGSSLPYARIQEYGGIAGRPGPFKKKAGHRPYLPPRPYLAPMFNDLQAAVSAALPQAVKTALKSQ
jgi:phage gpG-like protein